MEGLIHHENEHKFPFTKPNNPKHDLVEKATTSKGAQMHFKAEMKTYIRKTMERGKNCKFGFNLLWQQYSTPMQLIAM